MRILFLSDFSWNNQIKAGTERFTVELAEFLASKNHSITVLSPNWQNQPEFQEHNGVEYVFFKTHDIHKQSAFNALRRMNDYIFNAKQQGNFDVIHGFSTLPAILAGIKLKKQTNTKNISTVFIKENLTGNLPSIIQNRILRILKESNKVAFNFWSTQNWFKKEINLNNSIVIPVWIKNKFKPNLIQKNPLIKNILFVGRLTESKGVYVLLKAFSKVQEVLPEARLTLIGVQHEKEKKEFELAIQRLGLQDFVCLKGFLKEKYLIEEYNSADVTVSPALTDSGWTWTSLESMACGTPSIVTQPIDLNVSCEVTVKKNDVEDLKEKLLKVLVDKEFSERLSFNGLKVIEEYFSEKNLQAYLKLYEETK